MEERIAVLERDVKHIQSDVGDLKIDVRKLHEKIDGVEQKLTQKIEAVEEKLTQKIEAVEERLTQKIEGVEKLLIQKFDSLKDMIHSANVARAFDRVWWLLISGALLAVMAKGFKWI